MPEASIFSKEAIEKEFEQISTNFTKPMRIYLIGGCAMAFRGLKAGTKDADIVFESQENLLAFKQAAKEAGFKPLFGLEQEYLELKAKEVYVKGDFLLDLFAGRICGGLIFTPAMKRRAKAFKRIGKLRVKLASPEDIYLFKGITPRSRDLEDLITLQRSGLNWNVVKQEYLKQIKGSALEKRLKHKLLALKIKGFESPLLKLIK